VIRFVVGDEHVEWEEMSLKVGGLCIRQPFAEAASRVRQCASICQHTQPESSRAESIATESDEDG
jgi:hypothetical protein